MSDRELWDALTVLARRAGWIERGQRVVVEGDPREEVATVARDDALCLAYGKHKEVRLCCTRPKDHYMLTPHSWEGAMVGKSACVAETNIGGMVWTQCERSTNHAGEHGATGADGVRWTWGDAPQPNVPSLGDAALMVAYAEAKVRGHTGSHEATVNGQRWLFGAHEPRTMLMCDAKSRGESHDTAGRTCQLMTGHDGPHGARGAFGLMVSWMPDDPSTPRT